MKRQKINFPSTVLEWSEWFRWNDLKKDARHRGEVKVPNKKAGVYEVKYSGGEKRLTIGRATDLRMRIKQGLVKGKVPHSAGKKLRANEDVSRIVVRWAVTERPAAVEEELHRRYRDGFGGKLPKYVHHT